MMFELRLAFIKKMLLINQNEMYLRCVAKYPALSYESQSNMLISNDAWARNHRIANPFCYVLIHIVDGVDAMVSTHDTRVILVMFFFPFFV